MIYLILAGTQMEYDAYVRDEKGRAGSTSHYHRIAQLFELNSYELNSTCVLVKIGTWESWYDARFVAELELARTR